MQHVASRKGHAGRSVRTMNLGLAEASEPVLEETTRVPVALQLAAEGADVYQVVAIDAGIGNGWMFSPAVIERAVPHFQRVNVYLGHAGPEGRGPNGERQPADLAGVFWGGYYEPESAAIRGRLRLGGPAAPLARAVAEAYLEAYAMGEAAPDVGLSASLYLVAEGQTVVEITSVESLDVIATRPGRGGRFEAALTSMEDQTMAKRIKIALSEAPADIGATGHPVVGETAVVANPAALAEQVEAGYAAPVVPPPTAGLEGWQAAFGTLQQQIATLTAAVAAQHAPGVVQNFGAASDAGRRDNLTRIGYGQAPLDQLQTAVDALFGVRLPAGASFSRLRGIKDLYLFVTGDDEMRGIFNPERAQFANATTTTLNDLCKNALNTYVQQYST